MKTEGRGLVWSFLVIAAMTINCGCARAAIEPVVGRPEVYTVQKGDTLFKIARAHNLGVAAVMRVNRLHSRRVKPGMRLNMPTVHILPENPGTGVVLNVPERALYVIRNGKLIDRYPVAVGQRSWQTALGTFRLRSKVVNPIWKPTKDMVAREDIKDEPVKPGPDNPVGDRWMGWSVKGFGFHSTNAPRSIGNAVSHGCVRLYPEAAHRMFDQVAVGMPIYSIYEPVLLGELDGRIYLSVYPDIYHQGTASLAHVEKIVARNGLAPFVDPVALRQIVATHDGYPRPIAGTTERLTVNGTPITAPLALVPVRGDWVVPLRAVSQALGISIVSGAIGVTLTADGHTLTLAAGKREALFDGRPFNLAVAPTVVKGVMMAPLTPITEISGATIAYQKGRQVSVMAAGQAPSASPAAAQRP